MSALIYCPFPDAATAEGIGRTLISEQLIACINIGPPVRSVFRWNGATDACEEVPGLLKTDATQLKAAIARLEVLHPYEAPAILGWQCEAGAATREWLGGLGSEQGIT